MITGRSPNAGTVDIFYTDKKTPSSRSDYKRLTELENELFNKNIHDESMIALMVRSSGNSAYSNKVYAVKQVKQVIPEIVSVKIMQKCGYDAERQMNEIEKAIPEYKDDF